MAENEDWRGVYSGKRQNSTRRHLAETIYKKLSNVFVSHWSSL
jgi:hypothetical protein